MISYPDPQHCEATSQPGYIANRIYIRNAKYRKVLALLAFIFGSSFEEIKGNKSLTIRLKDSVNVISLYIKKINVI